MSSYRSFAHVAASPLLLLALACSSSGGSPGDGGATDGGNDAAQTDANLPQHVTVVAAYRGAPVAGVQVVFHDANGDVLTTAVTGADGRAVSDGDAPSMVSAVFHAFLTQHIVTWTAVEPGDELALEAWLDVPDPFVGAIDLTFPGAYSDGDGAATHYFHAVNGCRGVTASSTPITWQIRASCAQSPATVVALASRSGGRLAQSVASDLTIPVDGGTAELTLGAWAALTPFEVTATNLPAGDIDAFALSHQLVGNTPLEDHANVDDEGKAELHFLPEGASTVGVGVRVVVWHEDSVSEHVMRQTASTTSPSATLDFANALPEVTSATLTQTDPRRPHIAWTVAAPLTDTAGGLVRAMWRRDLSDYVLWTFIVPPTALSVTAPAMPAALDSALPIDETGDAIPLVEPTPVVTFVAAEGLADTAAFRRITGSVLPDSMYTSWVLDGVGALRTTTHSVGYD